MPKLKPETAKQKAEYLTKSYIKAGMNQSRLAEKEGITSQAVCQRLKAPAVRDALQKYLDSKSLKKNLITVAIEGLSAEKSISAAILVQKDGTVVKADDEGGIMIPDHNARHKYWHDLLTILGKLKPEVGNSLSVNNIVISLKSDGLISKQESEIVNR